MTTQRVLDNVSAGRLRENLFHLTSDPLPFRKVNHTVEDHEACSLDEADGYIRDQLATAGLPVAFTPYNVQAFRCDSSKPLHHLYSRPLPDDPWYPASNLEATITGNERPEEIIQLVSHKDSMSWIDSPGAHDNACGTVANLEIARVLAQCSLRRTVRVLFCNEEHTPWTSQFAAEAAASRGDTIVGVMNQDSLDTKTDADAAAGQLIHTVAYSTSQGAGLAELIAGARERHGIEIDVRTVFKARVNDDDGMFIKAGFRTTVMNTGSHPNADSQYHLVGDRPERVNMENLKRSTQLALAAVLELDPSDPPNSL